MVSTAVIEATPAGYREKGRFTPPNQPARRPGSPSAQSRTWPHPVLSDGRLYLRDLNIMWVYDVKGSSSGTR